MKRNQKGFSLIELLIVVAIMLVIASIAVPAVIASQQAANETAAVNTLRTVITAESGYHQLYGNYSAKATALGGAASDTGCPNIPATTGGCFLADDIAKLLDAGVVNGYTFAFTGAGADVWTLSATPNATGSSGRKAFFTDQTGVIRAAVQKSACTVACAVLGS